MATNDNILDETTDLLALSPNHRRFVNLYMSGQYSVKKISELLNVHENTVRKWMKRDDVKLYLSDMQSEQQKIITNQLSAMTTKAAERLNELLSSNIDGVALQAVKDVLDRGGHKAKQEIKKDITITTFEQQINKVLQDTMGDLIDVEYEEVE